MAERVRRLRGRPPRRACWCRSSRFRRGQSWGIGEIPDLAAARALARRRRARLRAAAAGQRDAGRAELAVLRAERDGDRSDLHRGRRRPRVGSPRGERARATRIAATLERRATAPSCRLRRGPRAEGPGLRRRVRVRSSDNLLGTGDAPRPFACRVSRARALVARRLRALPRAARRARGRHWREWDAGLRDRDAGRARRGARSGSSARAPLLQLPAVDRRRAVAARRGWRRRRSACSATFRSWSAATAPTSGRGSTSSTSTRPSARRPTRSRRPGRTGACRRTAGTWSRQAATSGCASAPAAAPSSTTASASITWSASIRTFVREADGTRRLRAGRRSPAAGQGERAADAVRAGRRAARSPRTSASSPTSCASRSPRGAFRA